MKLNLTEKLNSDEITEIRKRVFSFVEQMFMQGVSVGRELNREGLQSETETFIKDRISAMTAYFVRDDIWEAMPPYGYNPDPQIGVPDASEMMMGRMEKSIQTAQKGIVNISNQGQQNDEPLPEWINSTRPFK